MRNMKLKDYQLKYALNEWIINPTKDQCVIYDLIEGIANDCNSSMFREDITNIMSGREPSVGKHGYDHDTLPIEIKPKNYSGKSKLNGGGQFSDFTWKRHQKHMNDDVVMSISGFNYGRLVFIVEFLYSELIEKVETQLNKLLPEGDMPNRYVRSCSFSYLNWKDINVDLIWISPNFEDYKGSMVAGLYKTLKDLTKS